jgi:hypothetical protein
MWRIHLCSSSTHLRQRCWPHYRWVTNRAPEHERRRSHKGRDASRIRTAKVNPRSEAVNASSGGFTLSIDVVEAGRKGARARWGPPRRHNTADLDPVRRERVDAYIEAERRAQQREQAEHEIAA